MSTLKPEDRVARYRIIGPLGAGGMGEVYRARDPSLERDVALKILPPDLLRNPERVRRFMLEARSASSLNHPHIVTIYEIGEDRVQSPGVELGPDAPTVHYISMELVAGETLGSKIHGEKTDLKTLLGWLAQAAEGLAKAHAAGIVHRDLKPGNIMVSRDGYAKILDFGLAKLTERHSVDSVTTAAPTVDDEATGEGVVLGTVAYMSPEQVQGKAVDTRSDVFSFGCMLYEAATRRRPFAAESSIETMHRILRDPPDPIESLNPKAPVELRRLIRRCLAKNPEQRLQSMKDLALELHEIVDEYEALSASLSSGSGAGAPGAAAQPRSRMPMLFGGVVLVMLVLAGAWWSMRRSGVARAPAAAEMTVVTTQGEALASTLSPDGRYLAYLSRNGAQKSIRVRQLATGSDVEVLPPQITDPQDLQFSPDGDYLFYRRVDPSSQGYNVLFRIPALGGAERRRAYDVDSRVSFAPDGKKLVFRRHLTSNGDAIVVLDLDGDKETILATINAPQSINVAPAWSPDGTRVAVAETSLVESRQCRIVTFRLSDAQREEVSGESWTTVNSLAWMPDGRSLALAATERSLAASNQIWLQEFPGGERSKVTNDPYDYNSLVVSANGSTLEAQRIGILSNVWTVGWDGAEHGKPLTSSTTVENSVLGFSVADDGSVYYIAMREGYPQVMTLGADGRESQLTSEPTSHFAVRPLHGAGIVYSRAEGPGVSHLWRADRDGGNARPITSGLSEWAPNASPTESMILYQRMDQPGEVWAMTDQGSGPRRVISSFFNTYSYSPDGRRIMYNIFEHERLVTHIISTDAAPLATFELPSRAGDPVWAAGQDAISYLDFADSSANVYLQPIQGGPPRQITRFDTGNIEAHRWSRDGKHLILNRRIDDSVGIWSTAPDGRSPVLLKSFESGQIFAMTTPLDGSRVLFRYGTVVQHAVLIRKFAER